jgi:phosphatidylserine/phosphatidylglycerophosphate/cardiolipin synthase-like enzyme
MRVKRNNNGLTVFAVSGTYVVMFGFNMDEADCAGLLGFSIHRTDHTENEAYYLEGIKAFEETDPGLKSGSLFSTRDQPIQSFQWADYSAKPGHLYTYSVTALKGTPFKLEPFANTRIHIITECPESGDNDIYFNRGTAASQAYIRRYGDVSPEEVKNNKAFEWLSRGLNEALEDFIRSCIPGRNELRIAAYEFNYDKFLNIVKQVSGSGVDIKVVYDARKDEPKIENDAAVVTAGLENICSRRTRPKSYISHNKFIVKLLDGEPVSVWTGGTNFSQGGIFGHSNVAHVVQEKDVAKLFLDYWTELNNDPESTQIKQKVEEISSLPAGKPVKGTSVLFSPRKNLDALDWYANLARNAEDGLFMTFAFGMNDIFKEVYRNSKSPIRFALLDKEIRGMGAGPERDAELAAMRNLRLMTENVFAVGEFIKTSNIDGWVKERLTSLNVHVRYIHNKFMLLDPLSEDPIIIDGSANFSEASILRNDENMVISRGNTRIADIFMGEFMRLYSHHAFREFINNSQPGDKPKALRTDDWWRGYFGDNQRSTRRKFFARL